MSQVSFEDVQATISSKEDEVLSEEREKEVEERRKVMFEAIRTLPDKYRVILSLRDIQGFSYDEIAKILTLSPGTVDSRLHRARKMLRKRLEPFFSQLGGSHGM